MRRAMYTHVYYAALDYTLSTQSHAVDCRRHEVMTVECKETRNADVCMFGGI